MTNFLIPEYIDVCAVCGNQALRPGYPCSRCGALETLTFVPLDREAWAKARAQSLVVSGQRMARDAHDGKDPSS